MHPGAIYTVACACTQKNENVIKYPNRSNSIEKGVVLVHSARKQSILAEWQESEAAGHLVHSQESERMNARTLFMLLFIQSRTPS